ncbi:MAG: hypothetical protein WA876_12580 [Candidatus Acidiferrales bacterium]
MRRSGGVTAAAIVLFFGSGLLALLAVMMALALRMASQPKPPFPVGGILIVFGAFYLLMVVCGVVTGIGAFKRRPWGRILMIVIGVFGAGFSLLGSVGAVMGVMIEPSDPRVSAAVAHTVIAGVIAGMLIPLGVSIWWLILFTRPRVALEFESASAAPVFPLDAVTAASLPVSVNVQPEVALAHPVPAPQMPLSVRVIAVLEILFGVFAFLAPLNARFMGMTPPLMVFGFLVHGWGVNAFFIIYGIAPILFGAAILWRKSWGLDALIAFLMAQIANYGLMFISPARARYNSELQTQVQSFLARMKMPDGAVPAPSLNLMHTNLFRDFGFGSSIIIFGVALYFLFTRRRVFRAACQPPAASS